MRLAAICSVLSALVFLAGCGDGASAPTTASVSPSGGGPPPPPGGGAPAPPGADGNAPSDGGTPMENPMAMPAPGSEGTPPPEGSPQPGNPDAAGTPDGGTPGEGNPGDLNPDGSPRVKRVKTYSERMDETLAKGAEEEWLRMVRTNFIANPSSWENGLKKYMGWVPALRRPALGPRFGVVVHYANAGTLPKDFDLEASPQPIGSEALKTAMATFGQAAAERSGEKGESRRKGKAPQAEAAPAPTENPGNPEDAKAGGPGRAQLVYHTGEFGTKFMDQLRARIDAGEYGLFYKEAAESQAKLKRDPNDPNQQPSGEMPSPDNGTPAEGDAAPKASAIKTAAQPPRLGMAIVWLGRANSKEELEKLTESANVDLLLTFEIRLRPAKTGTFVDNITKLVISSPKPKKDEAPLFASAGLENREVMQAREKTQKEDSVDKEVKRAIEALDKVCKPMPLPEALTAEVIKRRVAALIAEKPVDPLPVLLELRFYACKNLLTEEEMTAAAVALLGETEYARMIATFPAGGATAAFGFPSLLNVLHGVSAVGGRGGPSLMAKAGGRPAGEAGKDAPPRKLRSKARPQN